MASLPQEREFHISTPGDTTGHLRLGVRKPGFSLLEMLIVLVIMTGTMALVWPSLRRAVDRSTLGEAANTFRSVLDDSRVRALQSGSPWLIRLETGSGLLQFGKLEQFMAQAATGRSLNAVQPEAGGTAELDSHQSLSEHFAEAISSQLDSDQDYGQVTLAAGPHLVSLPDQVQVADLVWNANVESFYPSQESLDESPAGSLARTWWIPILANGNSQDFSVRLQDANSGRSFWLVYSGSSGAIESIQ